MKNIVERELNAEEIEMIKTLKLEHKKQDQINANKARMTQLSQDFVQATIGEIIPNLSDKKAEFIRLHNEVRVLEGKLPREVKGVL